MLNSHRDKKVVRHESGRDGKILCDHRQDGNVVEGCHLNDQSTATGWKDDIAKVVSYLTCTR